MSLSRIAFVYKILRDAVVFVLLVTLLWPQVEAYLGLGYDDSTLPDEVVALDDTIYEFYQTTRDDFASLYENPTGNNNVAFAQKTDRQPLTASALYDAVLPSIVYINVVADGFWYIGSGSIISSDGVILTNHHVIEGADTVIVATHDGTLYEAQEVLAYDYDLDVAFIKIDATNLTPLPVSEARDVRIGDTTFVIGHPEGLLNTISLGNISGIRSYTSQGAGVQFQITNPISMGNSGGAVLNEYGELIAIPSWSLEYEDNAVAVQNVNFAIPMYEALAVLERK